MKTFSSATGAVILTLCVVVALIVVKVAVAILTASISITAQATDSFLDLFSIAVVFAAVRVASQPADEEHPFGHGKFEGVAAVVEAIFILSAAFFIVFSAVQRILHGAPLELTEAGIGVMAVSIIASILLSRHLKRVAAKTGSLALDALAKNINADIYSAAGVLAGLAVVRLTNLKVLDPVIALIMALFILKAAYDVVRRAYRELVDARLPADEQTELITVINDHKSRFAGFHAVRSRRAGNQRFVDLHLVMRRDASLEEAHGMCDHLEQDIRNCLPGASVVIHAEPCGLKDCLNCQVTVCAITGRGAG